MGMTVEIQTQGKEDFHFEEALKTLRTNIQFSGSNVKVIMFTSAVPGEGRLPFQRPCRWQPWDAAYC